MSEQSYQISFDEKSDVITASPQLTKYQTYYKYTLLTINTLFFIFSIILIVVGTTALNSTANTLTGNTLPRGIIILGIFILFVSILGLTALYRESKLLLSIYFAILSLCTIILLAVGIAVYSQSVQTIAVIGNAWIAQGVPVTNNNTTQYNYNTSTIIISVQSSLQCCGLYDSSTAALPCTATQSCATVLQNTIHSTYYTAGSCGIAFSILMLFCLAGIIVLIRGIRKKQFMAQKHDIQNTYVTDHINIVHEDTMPTPISERRSDRLTVPNKINNKPRGNTMLYDLDED